MGGGFEVQPKVVQAAADDVDQMAIAIRKARAFVQDEVHRTWSGGPGIIDAGEIVNDVADLADDSYGKAARVFDSVSERLTGIAASYRATDAEARRRFDRKLPSEEPYENQLPHLPHEPGIKQSDVNKVLTPRPADDGYSTFLEFEEKIGDAFKLGDELTKIELLDIPNPFHGWIEDWEGNWKEMDAAADAMAGLGDFWERLGGEVMATASRFDGTWTGNASDAARSWLNGAAFECIRHGQDMWSFSSDVRTKAQLLNRAIVPVLDLGDDLVGIVNDALNLLQGSSPDELLNLLKNPTDILGEAWDRAKRFGELLKRVWNAVDNLKKWIDGALLVFDGVVAAISEIGSPDSVASSLPSFERLPPMTVGVAP